jgi:hypothetical protein
MSPAPEPKQKNPGGRVLKVGCLYRGGFRTVTDLYHKISGQLKVFFANTKEDDLLVKRLTPKPKIHKPVYKNWFRKELEAKSHLHSQ